MDEKEKPLVIGVTGGSGSGKTSVTKAIYNHFPGKSIMILEHDSYYKDQSHLDFQDRLKTNYDHPLAFDTELMVDQLKALLNNQAVDVPVYDYKRHTRSSEVIHQEPKEVIIVEGIMVLVDQALRNLMDIKIYVDTDDDIRIIRRIKRDMQDRGRSLDSIIDQYLSVVKQMHEQFIEPSKRYADIIIPEGSQNQVAIDLVTTKIQNIFDERQ
ncbi:Uridine kinase [Alloiococcus otitis]|uniref:Uridine kinase n=1 Tax=Alloiococcus otitis ATCC 51267 TaxID=883081 RepID=K9ET37_9LACT|nr:uridine kinase [Alloiococcus otitis]EKU94147.1 uridine kinase [Alloiococcus otitis ATCC 51267]SUU81220.1 Uridine kinase [Alloiococcus otitis]